MTASTAYLFALLPKGLLRKECGTDLLRDPTGFIRLYIRMTNFVQELRLSCIDMAQNAANRGSQPRFLERNFSILLGNLEHLRV